MQRIIAALIYPSTGFDKAQIITLQSSILYTTIFIGLKRNCKLFFIFPRMSGPDTFVRHL